MKFDTFSLGEQFFTNPITVTEEDIIDFANKYDPQYFHVDRNAAEESPYGSLIASGFHTLAVVWSEWIKMDILGRDCLGGVGADEIRWRKPVLANDQLSGQFTIADKKKSANGKRGLLTIDVVIRNQKDEEVLTCNTNVYVAV
ncbi:MaoC/PaaZ C-terminal domain-containing protein [Lentibacillus sp. Marseille-P4043]|uniref:MaoC/PaaZ C-terminal domain-containing protein n=1 Tax=Lentibacillus sp. Marseille-P4043 TaxID=2040293 RepID=UPI000D0BA537|nr:MaoC/PaaZ C-terminal domain-containing protein [Lentibacillus sp. Marseille-P4043]